MVTVGTEDLLGYNAEKQVLSMSRCSLLAFNQIIRFRRLKLALDASSFIVFADANKLVGISAANNFFFSLDAELRRSFIALSRAQRHYTAAYLLVPL